jgi:hypothetical protein
LLSSYKRMTPTVVKSDAKRTRAIGPDWGST